MKTKLFQIYSIANPHFDKVEVLTNKNELLKGQFVEFRVVKGDFEYLYPSEKFCFLPESHKGLFWSDFKINEGKFKYLPEYIKLLSLFDILKITIEPHQLI
jgi:hypothetical protein